MTNFGSHLNVRLIRACPICSQEYNQSMVQIINESEFGILTYATCSRCGANLLSKFASMPQGVVGNAILTDLQVHEVMDFADEDDLQADDVLEIQNRISKKKLISELRKEL